MSLMLATGTTLCQHANAPSLTPPVPWPPRGRLRGVALSRPTAWCPASWPETTWPPSLAGAARELGVPEVLMFETEDFQAQNEKSVVLCLLEVALARGPARPCRALGPQAVRIEIERELRAAPSASKPPSAGEDTTETPAARELQPWLRMTPSDPGRNLGRAAESASAHARWPGLF